MAMTQGDDPYDLERFVSAQSGAIDRALSELQRGRKESHWMWFVFPQIAGLGSSPTAQLYAIGTGEEARAYLAHPVLGARLRDCVRLALQTPGRSARDIFGSPDDLKFRSSLTLFAEVSDEPIFREGLARFFDNRPDEATLRILKAG